MNPINRLLSRGESTFLATGHGDEFVVTRGALKGRKFVARLDVEAVIDTDGVAGGDPRMQSVIRIKQPAPLELQSQDVIQGVGKSWRVLNREDNAATITVDYYVEQIV